MSVWKRTKTWHLHLIQAMFLVDAASWVIPQGLCQPPATSVTIFPQLLSPVWSPSPELPAAGQPQNTAWSCYSTLQLPGDGVNSRDEGLQPPCTPVQVHLQRTVSVLHPYRCLSPAAQALPSWRNATFNPARSFFELDKNLSANQAGSSFHKVHEVCFHQPYHTDEFLFTSNNLGSQIPSWPG